MKQPFRVGITADARGGDGRALFDFSAFDAEPGIEWEFLPPADPEIAPDVPARYDALVLPTARCYLTRRSLVDAERLTLVARLAVGFDKIDIDACTEAGVIVTVAPEAVRRPMATAAMGFLLALTLRIPQKDRLVREGRWADEVHHLGTGLVGRTLGVIGLGNIGREILRLAAPLSMHHLASDPYVDPPSIPKRLRVDLVPLEELLSRSDFVCVTCPLTPETRHLLDAVKLSLLKSSAYLINIARGPIVDEKALVQALETGQLAGAALDVFEEEPVDGSSPLVALDNVILSPHAIGRTDERFIHGSRAGAAAVLAVARGVRPPHVVNPEAFVNARLRSTLGRNRRRRAEAVSGGRLT